MIQAIAAAGLAAALFAAPEPPSSPETQPAAATGQKGDLKAGERREKVICRTEVATGTRFGKRVCMTKADFERRTEESRGGLMEMQRNVNTNYSTGR